MERVLVGLLLVVLGLVEAVGAVVSGKSNAFMVLPGLLLALLGLWLVIAG